MNAINHIFYHRLCTELKNQKINERTRKQASKALNSTLIKKDGKVITQDAFTIKQCHIMSIKSHTTLPATDFIPSDFRTNESSELRFESKGSRYNRGLHKHMYYK